MYTSNYKTGAKYEYDSKEEKKATCQRIDEVLNHSRKYFLTSENPSNLDYRTVKNNFSDQSMKPVVGKTTGELELERLDDLRMNKDRAADQLSKQKLPIAYISSTRYQESMYLRGRA